jgi:hypothetical protein
MSTSTVLAPINQADVFIRALDSHRRELTPEVAQYFLSMELSPADRARLDDLAEKARQNALSAAEQPDLDEFRRLGRLVELLKLKARKSLAASS